MLGWETCTNVKIIMKSTKSPTLGLPNPIKIRLKVAFRATFSDDKDLFVGSDWFYVENRLQET